MLWTRAARRITSSRRRRLECSLPHEAEAANAAASRRQCCLGGEDETIRGEAGDRRDELYVPTVPDRIRASPLAGSRRTGSTAASHGYEPVEMRSHAAAAAVRR